MTTKEYLEQYAQWKTEKLHLLSDRELIVVEEALPAGIDYSADRVQTSPEDGMLKKIIRIQKRTKEIDERVEVLTEKIKAIKALIDEVPDPISSNILWYRYIELMDWLEVANIVGYSEDHTKGYLHCKALQDFEKLTPFNTSYRNKK